MKCPFCREEIQDNAVKCRHCGSMIKQMEFTDYAQVPWFRKNWFAILSAFFFAPALLFLVLTGEIYYSRKGAIRKYSKGAKIVLGILGAITFYNLIQLLAT